MAKKNLAKRPNTTLVGGKLHYPASVAVKYRKKLRKLILKMTQETYRKISKLFYNENSEEFFESQKRMSAMDESISSQMRILTNALMRKFKKVFDDASWDYAENFISTLDKSEGAILRSSFKTLTDKISLNFNTKTPGMKEFLKASVAENVSLIKSIPDEYYTRVVGQTMRSITQGGPGQLYDNLKKYEGMSLRRAKFIAEDQTRKAHNTMNKLRMESVGIKKFIWNHSGGGQTPRELHLKLDGQVFSFEDLPVIDEKTGETGIPGKLPKCKCFMTPVLEFADEDYDNVA